MRARIFLSVACSGALVISGCGDAGNAVSIPPEEAAKINTTPPPEKSKAGKPNMDKPVAD